MTWIAAAVGGSAALGAAGSIFSGIMGASGAKKSASAIRYSADLARKTALDLNEKARGDLAPFRETGAKAAGQLSDILSGNKSADDYFKDSAQFRFESDIGQRNINRQLSARGGYNSGAGLEALSLFNSALVGAEGEKQFQRIFNVAQLGGMYAGKITLTGTESGVGGFMVHPDVNSGGAHRRGQDTNRSGEALWAKSSEICP